MKKNDLSDNCLLLFLDDAWPNDESSPNSNCSTSVKIETENCDLNDGIRNNDSTTNTSVIARNGQNHCSDRNPVRLKDLDNRFGRVPFGRSMRHHIELTLKPSHR